MSTRVSIGKVSHSDWENFPIGPCLARDLGGFHAVLRWPEMCLGGAMTRVRGDLLFACLLLTESARAQDSATSSAEASIAATAARAPRPAIRAVSLSEALAYARIHQPAIRAAVARIGAQAAQAKVPSAQWYPSVGATAQLFAATANNTTGSYVSTGFVDIPRIGGTRATGSGSSLAPYASSLVGAGVRQELFDFGRITAQTAAQDALTDVTRQRSRSVILDVTFSVEEAYFSVFAAKAILTASQDAYDRSLVHRNMAAAGVNSGLRSPIELTRAEADLANFDIGRIRAAGGLSIAQAVFAAAVGVSDSALDVSAAPPAPSELADLTSAMQRAEARDPRLLEALAELRAAERATSAIAAELRPNLSLTGTISGRAGAAPPSGTGSLPDGGGFLPSVPNWDVGVVLNWPLFDGVISARTDAARAREQVRREEIGSVQESWRVTIREAYAAVAVARTVLPGLHRAVDSARANYAQADARFKSGLGTSVELADAEGLRAEAEIRLALGEFELARTRAAFGRAIAEGL
jgi:outer membrane protein